MAEPSTGVVWRDSAEGVWQGGVEGFDGSRRGVSQLAFEFVPVALQNLLINHDFHLPRPENSDGKVYTPQATVVPPFKRSRRRFAHRRNVRFFALLGAFR